MLVEALITLVNARGIDFKHVAGNASNLKGPAKPRRLSKAELKLRRELKIATDVLPTARGSGSRVMRRPMWSHAELAHAMAGIPRMPELALYYSLAGWLGAFEELHAGLMLKQLQRFDADWPAVLEYSGGRLGEPHDWISKLATLVLLEDAHKNDFLVVPALPYVLIGMDEPVWKRHLAERFEDLKRQYERWYTVALNMTQRRIMATDDEVVAETAA